MIAFYANKLEVKKAAEEMGILHILNEAIHKSFGYTSEAEINDLIHSVNDLFFYPNFLEQLDGCGFEYMELHPEYTFMEVTPEGFLPWPQYPGNTYYAQSVVLFQPYLFLYPLQQDIQYE